MGVNCCTENKSEIEFDQEVVFSKTPIKKKAGSYNSTDPKPIEEIPVNTLKAARSYDEDTKADQKLLDFPVHGRSDPKIVKEQTRVVKRGKKIRK
jgi:hypothetical protein